VSFVPTIEEELSEELGHQESHLRERSLDAKLGRNFADVSDVMLGNYGYYSFIKQKSTTRGRDAMLVFLGADFVKCNL
jgi:hypothetical protein